VLSNEVVKATGNFVEGIAETVPPKLIGTETARTAMPACEVWDSSLMMVAINDKLANQRKRERRTLPVHSQSLTGFHDDSAHVTSEGGTVLLLLLLGDRTPDTGIDHAF
jgi:hypothetical protein